MAHFTASFSSACIPTGRHGSSAAPPPAHGYGHVAAGDDRPGPGWFDSSWDLQRGLEVREGLPEDAKLHEWIEVCLRS